MRNRLTSVAGALCLASLITHGLPAHAIEYRSIDGYGNNQVSPSWGSAGVELLRMADADYRGDSAYGAAIDDRGRLSPRAISNLLSVQTSNMPNARGMTSGTWQWGQFLDHDIDLTPEADPQEPAFVAVPLGDPAFDPFGTGAVVLPFLRSAWVAGSVPRQQQQAITGWIDASNVYGSDAVRAGVLRTLDGSGRLATSAGDLLPFNTAGLPNAGGTDAGLFLAGDVRANEQVGLTSLHTLFVREHNRLVDELKEDHPDWDGETLYQQAKALVEGEIQAITYNEFL
ncbi:MAG: peroxidase family protein, partial [Planctomycetales bacterium]|nr:peroxidase family protein [Planctomycetales bacterium]